MQHFPSLHASFRYVTSVLVLDVRMLPFLSNVTIWIHSDTLSSKDHLRYEIRWGIGVVSQWKLKKGSNSNNTWGHILQSLFPLLFSSRHTHNLITSISLHPEHNKSRLGLRIPQKALRTIVWIAFMVGNLRIIQWPCDMFRDLFTGIFNPTFDVTLATTFPRTAVLFPSFSYCRIFLD